MTLKEEIALWKRAKKILSKEIDRKHDIREMDMNCFECRSAIMIAFINDRLDVLEYGNP